jgi:uncharacterized protein YjbJ (UPF0337 family)
MNWKQIEGNWDQLKGRVKEKWGALTDDDLQRMEGKRDRLVGKIKEMTGKAEAAIEKELDALFHR